MDHPAAPGSLLRSFERHLRAQNRSERTIGNYLESARLAAIFLEGRGKQLEDATLADLEDFLGDILRRRTANTAATRYKVLRVLYRWLEEEEELPNPMARMKPPIVPEQPVPIVPADGLRRLLAACAGRSFEARRDTAIIMLSSDDYGSSVERTAKLHPLWQGPVAGGVLRATGLTVLWGWRVHLLPCVMVCGLPGCGSPAGVGWIMDLLRGSVHAVVDVASLACWSCPASAGRR